MRSNDFDEFMVRRVYNADDVADVNNDKGEILVHCVSESDLRCARTITMSLWLVETIMQIVAVRDTLHWISRGLMYL